MGPTLNRLASASWLDDADSRQSIRHFRTARAEKLVASHVRYVQELCALKKV